MNVKNISIALITSLGLIFLCSSVLFYYHYKAIDQAFTRIIQAQINQKNPEFGYSFLADLNGTIISQSPIDKLSHNTIDAFFDPDSKEEVMAGLEDVKNKKSVLLKNIKDRHHHPVHAYFTIENNVLHGFIYFPNELKKFGIDHERHALIFLSLSLMFLLCCLTLLAFAFITIPSGAWICVGLISFFMITEIWYLWSLRNSVGFKEDLQANPILSHEQEEQFFKNINTPNRTFVTIPTGIFIDYGQFTQNGVSDIYPGVFLNGYIWQRYDPKLHEGISREVIISNASYSTLKEFYREKSLNEERICWSFSCCLYQNYNARLFPFDHRHLTVNLLHKDFEKNIALSVDLGSYDSIDALMLPGMSLKTFKSPHWNISKSFFAHNLFNFKTSLGYPLFEHNKIPYLQYIITMQRTLSGSFLMYFILLLVVLIILFILLTSFLRQGGLIDIVGFSTLSVVGSCSGLLFVLITSQISLRQTLANEGIVYLEYLYFVCYFAIMAVIINSILFAKGRPNFIVYKDNLICKLIYWPLILLSMVLISAYALF